MDFPTFHVADRAGVGAGRFWPHHKHAGSEEEHGAATCCHRVYVQLGTEEDALVLLGEKHGASFFGSMHYSRTIRLV